MTLLVADRELLDRFRQGDPDALDRVYRHFAPDVARFLRAGFVYSSNQHTTSIGGVTSPFELESAVQEVFVRAFAPGARTAYDGLRPYGGFLMGIARHVVLDALRRRSRRGEVLVGTDDLLDGHAAVAGAFAATAASDLHESLERRQGEELVRAFLAEHCDPRDRVLYELRYQRELSQDLTAKEAGLTRIQVRRWETKFRTRLLRYLKKANYVR